MSAFTGDGALLIGILSRQNQNQKEPPLAYALGV